MPRKLKINCPLSAKVSSPPAMAAQASRAMPSRWAGVSVGVMARKPGTTAMGSTMTKSELVARKVYSRRVTFEVRGERLEVRGREGAPWPLAPLTSHLVHTVHGAGQPRHALPLRRRVGRRHGQETRHHRDGIDDDEERAGGEEGVFEEGHFRGAR